MGVAACSIYGFGSNRMSICILVKKLGSLYSSLCYWRVFSFCHSGSCKFCDIAECDSSVETIIYGHVNSSYTHFWRCSISSHCGCFPGLDTKLANDYSRHYMYILPCSCDLGIRIAIASINGNSGIEVILDLDQPGSKSQEAPLLTND